MVPGEGRVAAPFVARATRSLALSSVLAVLPSVDDSAEDEGAWGFGGSIVALVTVAQVGVSP